MKLGVVGLGKLGLPLALVFVKAGYEVYGIDISEKRISEINEYYEKEAPEPKVTEYLQNYGKNLILTTDYQYLKDVPVIIIITQSPSLPDGKFDATYVIRAVEDIHNINMDALVVISSTMNVGVVEKLSKIHNRICYNPEMIKQGSMISDFENPKFVIIGAYTKEDGEELANVWKKVHKNPIYFVSPVDAEIIKISLNISFTLGITFANIIGEFCEKYNADPNTVLDIVYKDRRDYKPGLGFMGPCFPRDVRLFRKLSLENSIESGYLFSIILSELNNYLVEKYTKKIKEFNKKKVGILGIAYKPNIPYIFESQPIKIVQQLLNESDGSEYEFYIYDPLAEKNGREVLVNKNVYFCSELKECIDKSELIFIGTVNFSNIQTNKIVINPWKSGLRKIS